MSGNVHEVTSILKDIVAKAGQIPGTQLSALLRARVPEWSPTTFGVRNLREFVASHVSGVIEAGRSGMDVVYAPEGTALMSTPSAPDATTQVDFWRVWSSPNGPHALVVDSMGPTLRVVPRGGPVESGQVLLEPPAVDFHRRIAEEFLPSLSVDLRSKLQGVIDDTSKRWWQDWVRELRGTEYLGVWNAFRRQKLEERLSLQLRTTGFAPAAIDRLLKTIREQHVLARPRARRTVDETFHRQDDAATLQRVVTEAVQRMSITELRELRLPVGIVLDVLATSKPR